MNSHVIDTSKFHRMLADDVNEQCTTNNQRLTIVRIFQSRPYVISELR